jgi:PAS domain S-box-containing protein
MREKGQWHGETEIQKSDGSTFWAEIHIVNFTSPDSPHPYIICIGHDLTAKKLMMERAWHVENPSSHIIDSMREPLFVIDAAGMILRCNKSLPGLIGYPREEIIGLKQPYPWLEEAEARKYHHAVKSAGKGNPAYNLPLLWTRKNNTRFVVALVFSPLNSQDGNSGSRFVVSARDLSNISVTQEMKRHEDRIEMLQTDLQRKTVTLSTILEIQRLVLCKAPISQIFREIIKGVQKLLKNDLAGIYLVDPKKKSLSAEVLSKRTAFARSVVRPTIPIGVGLLGITAATGKIMIVNKAQMDPRSLYPGGIRPRLEHVIVVPLQVANTILGVLAVARGSNPEFVEEDALIIKSFADATTVAIENARLVAETRKDIRRDGKGKASPKFDDLNVFASPEKIA